MVSEPLLPQHLMYNSNEAIPPFPYWSGTPLGLDEGQSLRLNCSCKGWLNHVMDYQELVNSWGWSSITALLGIVVWQDLLVQVHSTTTVN